jgi:hypothetical protein
VSNYHTACPNHLIGARLSKSSIDKDLTRLFVVGVILSVRLADGSKGLRMVYEGSGLTVIQNRRMSSLETCRGTPFVIEQPTFTLQSSTVAGERTIGSDHAMTGHDDANWIGSIGKSYGAHGRRLS